jgi:hypothetical protein
MVIGGLMVGGGEEGKRLMVELVGESFVGGAC